MNKFSDITDKSKLTSMVGNEAQVDIITEQGIYTSFRGQSLKSYNRLFFSKDDIENKLSEGIIKLIDGRIRTTLKEIRSRFSNGVFIIGVDKEQSMQEIIEDNKETLVTVGDFSRKFYGVKEIDGQKKIILSPVIRGGLSTAECKVRMYYDYDYILPSMGTGNPNKLSLDAIARELFDVKDSSYLLITDLNE